MKDLRRCGTCRFYREPRGLTRGACIESPPQPIVGSVISPAFPEVTASMFCGKWKPSSLRARLLALFRRRE